jgi:hypothetical protein
MSDAAVVDRKCSKCRKRPARPGQYYCSPCHAEKQKAYRKRRSKLWRSLVKKGVVPERMPTVKKPRRRKP